MPSVDENLAKLLSNSGFRQIPLDEESKLLTTFVTPFGRFCFNRLPFGISSSVSALGQRSSNALCPRYLCQMDDVLIHGLDQSEDDGRVRAVLHCLQEVGLTLNDKCEFSRSSIRFLAHIIDSSGLQADPQKTTAVTQFPVPSVSPGYSDSWGTVSLQRVWIHSKK